MSVHDTAPGQVEDSIVIERPVAQVFAFYSDFRNLPRFLGDVMRVEIVDGRISRWTVHALGVDLRWTVVITELQSNACIAYQTDGLAPTRWTVRFSSGDTAARTIVRETMSMPGGLFAKAALAALGKPPAQEVHANLRRLKELLETGHVTTGDYAVKGKFPTRPTMVLHKHLV